MNRRTGDFFLELEKIDPSLRINPGKLGKLARKRVQSQPYSQHSLFSSMADGQISLFDHYPSPIADAGVVDQTYLVEAALRRASKHNRFEVRCGPSSTSKYLTGSELVYRWNNARAMVNVTDLHIRGTAIEKLVNPYNLSWFNLLQECGENAATQEMMSLVMSSRGCLSDSHSDAPDSSNYCFTGEKVWLMWDTREGKKLGLEDCSIDNVTTDCSFDMDRFLQARSARWLTVSAGQALFLPGEYTHKVITTKRYLGVGSFYVSLPNSLRSIARWNLHGPLWSVDKPQNGNDAVLTEITHGVKNRIRNLRLRSCKLQQKLGYDYLPQALETWDKSTTRNQQSALQESSHFADYLHQLFKVEQIF